MAILSDIEISMAQAIGNEKEEVILNTNYSLIAFSGYQTPSRFCSLI